MNIDLTYTLDLVKKLMAIDSPTGFTMKVIDEIEAITTGMGYAFSRNHKGNGIVSVKGKEKSGRALSAHVDTLGLMVRSISSSGTLKFVRIGGLLLPTVDGEYCT
ncbi:MAG: aminopeptidase, partial [Symbiobacteriaceae bacterium]|nr:aminopeptidase [Symbiobacteriaceae bacterium]